MRFSGPDAAQFLQGQVSNDTRRLAAGSPLLAAYSTPQGRVAALLHLVPYGGGILAILPRDILASTVERLRKFILRAKVQINDVSDQFSVLGLHDSGRPGSLADIVLPSAEQAYLEHDGIGASRVASGMNRFWVIGETQRLIADPGAADPAALQRIDQDWRLANIQSGMPQIYAATREMFVAQMLNLDLVDGISFSKGCYTGQEIIARTQHLGRIKRRLFRIQLPAGAWQIGQMLRLADGRSGRLTEVAAFDDGFEALAVLPLEAGVDADSATGAEGAALAVAAVQLPLPYPLTSPS